jgi:hypothetical protein
MHTALAVSLWGLLRALVLSAAPGQVDPAALLRILSALQARLPEFLNRIPVGQEATYKFRSPGEFAKHTRNRASWFDFGSVDCCVDLFQSCNTWNDNWGRNDSIQNILYSQDRSLCQLH